MKAHRGANPTEKGQALVLIIFSIVGLLGFAALAVDMGQIFMTRRNAQAAADAAALAAASEAVAGSLDRDDAIARAFEMAGINGFNNDQVGNWVVVNNPPVGGPYCGVCGSPTAEDYYQVKITVRMNPIFSQFVYGKDKQTTVEAIAHAEDISTITGNDALVSLSNLNDSLEFDGTTSVNLSGGNIRSMGGMVKNGASGSIVVTDGKVYYSTTFKGHTNPFSPKPSKNQAGDVNGFTPPYCPSGSEVTDGTWTKTGSFYQKQINGVKTFYYPNGLSVENLPSGIHCIENGIGKGNYVGNNVLLVLLSGGIKQTGNDSFDLRADNDIKDANGNQFGGLLMYVPLANTSVLQFGGNSEAYVHGTIYAPGATCNVGGTSDGQAYHTSIVCQKVKIHGTPDLKIIYKSSELFQLPPTVELAQ